MELASQNLLQYSDHRSQIFNKYLNRSTFMIFVKSQSFEKNCQIHTVISEVQFKILPNATIKSQSFAL